CENFKVMIVPPLKSTPKGMPCQKNIESNPATVKISEKPRKYHFFDIQSTFTLRNNSTFYPLYNPKSCHPAAKRRELLLNAQRFSALLLAQMLIEDHA